MGAPVYTVDGYSFGFSIKSIRKRYTEKENFFNDIINAHPDVNKTKLKKVLERVWNEAFPQEET
jgi:hypothetical protein